MFNKVSPGLYTLKESYGVTSGRTDTTSFSAKGRVIHVEVIASENMVLRDVTNLHQSSADLCITVLLDEKYDPKVAKAYYRANPKNLFPTIWLSDVLDVGKEDRVLGRLDELLQGPERQIEHVGAKTQARFNDYIERLNISQAKYRTVHLGLFPRRFLGLFGKVQADEELFHKFESMGVVGAADPLHLIAGIDWFFSHNGQFLIVKAPPADSDIFTQVAIGDSGEVIFTYCDLKNRIEEIFGPGIPKMFSPTFDLACTILKNQEYDGIVDILAVMTGLKSKQWIQQGKEDYLSRLLHDRVFYEDAVNIPMTSHTSAELEEETTIGNFYQDVFVQLQRNTRKVFWNRKQTPN